MHNSHLVHPVSISTYPNYFLNQPKFPKHIYYENEQQHTGNKGTLENWQLADIHTEFSAWGLL